jgi:hypothetical protein
MSGAAFLVVIVVLATGWERGLKDEGSAAHIWQLFMAVQIPVVLAFAATADWRRRSRTVVTLAAQAAAFAVACAPVAIFHL